VLREAVDELWDLLRTTPYQLALGLAVFVFGLVMVFDGDAALLWIVLLAVCVLCGVIGMYRVDRVWHTSSHGALGILRSVIGIEIGSLCAFAAWMGFEGTLAAVAAMLGAAAAQGAVGCMRGESEGLPQWVVIAIYSICIVVAIVMAHEPIREKILLVISPLVGGSVVVGSAAFVVTHVATGLHTGWMDPVLKHTAPERGSLTEFLELLWSVSSKDVGLFAGSRFRYQVLGHEWQLDRVLCYASWALLSVVGWAVGCWHHYKAREERGKRDGHPGAREPLLSNEGAAVPGGSAAADALGS